MAQPGDLKRPTPAKNSAFDPTGSSLTSTKAEAAIKELDSKVSSSASPGFSFGRASNVNAGTWLQCETVPSNKSGRYVYINSAVINRVFVSSENVDTFSIEVYSHDGDSVNLTLLGSVSVTAARGDDFTVSWAVANGKQLALKLSSGSARNVVAGLELSGTN